MFLNSEVDYRDQRNLTVAVAPTAVAALQARLGGDPRVALKGRDIVVTGSAMRIRIVFSANGQPTDKYYYQTHVRVSDADQIVVETHAGQQLAGAILRRDLHPARIGDRLGETAYIA